MDMVLVGVITLAAIGLLVSGRLRPDLVALLLVVVLALTGLVSPEEAVSGFSNPATISVLAMLILAGGLNRTGATTVVGQLISRLAGPGQWRLLAMLLLTAAVLSAFVNNTAVVAVFLPLTVKLATERSLSPSLLLLPLSFASMLGGTLTLIGTSTNLLVSALGAQEGLPPFTMFEFTKLGLPVMAVGLVYLLSVGRWLVPARKATELTATYNVREYFAELEVAEDAPIVGQAILETELEKKHDVEILEVFRGEQKLWRPRGVPIKAGDLLLVHGPVDALMALRKTPGLAMKADRLENDEALTSEDVTLAEAVIAPTSRLRGRTPRQIFFRQQYNLSILAVRRHGRSLRERLSDTRLGVGDTLLLQGTRRDLNELAADTDFIMLGEVETKPPRRERMWAAIGIMAAVAGTAAFGILPILVAALAGVAAMALAGCLTMQEAYESVDWPVIFLLAGVIPLGLALQQTGAAQRLADGAVTLLGGLGPVAVLSAFYLLTSLLTELMSNNATAVMLTPVAVATAQALGVDPRPFLVAIAFAASASFMTPLGYQTNLLVFGPGGYRYTDYARVGTPLNLLLWAMATVLIPIMWPLR